jgi:hypothetical protein
MIIRVPLCRVRRPEAGSGYRQGVRRFRIWGLVTALFVIASGVALMVPIVRGAASAGDPEVTVTKEVRGYTCAQIDYDDYCQRLAADLARRAPVPAAEIQAAKPLADELEAVLAGPTCPETEKMCIVETVAPTAETVRRAIVGAGFLGPIVRDARGADPAPRGAIMFAVPAGGACLVGHVSGHSSFVLVVGPLRDSGCAYP